MSDVYSFKVSSQGKKDLKKLPKKDKVIIKKYIVDNLFATDNPFRYDLDLKKIKNENDLYRYRVGKYRIICQIKKRELIILLLNVGKRNDNTYKFNK